MTWTGLVMSPFDSQHRMGAAWDSTLGHGYGYYQVGEDYKSTTKGVEEATVTGALVASTQQDTAAPSRRHGVDGTYDPLSHERIVTWRARNGEIRLQQLPQSGGFKAPVAIDVDGVPQIAFGTPSVACGADFASYNCIIVWASAAEVESGKHNHILRWMQFENYPATGFVFGPRMEFPYLMYGPPRVTYQGPELDTAFLVSWMASYDHVQVLFTARKGSAVGDVWTDVYDHGDRPYQRIGFAVGSANGDGEMYQVSR